MKNQVSPSCSNVGLTPYVCLIYLSARYTCVHRRFLWGFTYSRCLCLFLFMSCICSLHSLPVALGNRLLRDHTGLAPRVGGEEGRKGKNLLRQPQQPNHHMDEADLAGTSALQAGATLKSNFSSQHYVFFQDYC